MAIRRVESYDGKVKAFPFLFSAVNQPTRIGIKLASSCPFYYGYVIVLVGTLAKALSAPGQTTFLGSVIPYIQDDLGIKRSTVSSLYTCATLLSSVCLPVIGWFMDRFGLRFCGIMNASMMALAVISLGHAVRGGALLTVLFFFLRFFGQGGMQLIGTTLISNWWIGKRGLMQGVSGVGLALSMTGLFPIFARLSCESIGWRNTFTAIGIFMLVVFVPACALFFLETPEMYGLLPDNGKADPEPAHGEEDGVAEGGPEGGSEGDIEDAEESPPSAQPPQQLEGKTLGEALRTFDFYAVTGSCFIWAFNATGIFFHLIAIIGNDLGKGEGEEGTLGSVVPHVYLTTALASSGFTLTVGYLFDRINPKWIIITGLLMQSTSIFLFARSKSEAVTILSAFVFGASNGCMNNMSGVVHAHLFGRRHLGKISGFGYSCLVVGSALGPLPLGLVQPNDLSQQSTCLLVIALVPLATAAMVLLCKMKPLVPREGPEKREGGQTEVEMQRLLVDDDDLGGSS